MKTNFSIFKPDGFLTSIRFFIFFLLSIVFASCNSEKTLVKAPLAATADSHTIPVPDSLAARYKADNLFMDAVSANMQDDKEKAFRIFTQFATIAPDNATVHYELSKLWLERNNFEFSMKESKRAVELDSTNKWMQMQYADLLAYNGSFNEAASIYNKIASRERSPEEYLYKQATLLQKAKKYDEALAVYDHLVLFLGENDENLLLQRQQLYLSKNDVEGAAGEVRKLMKYYPKNVDYALLLAALYENNNIENKAAEAYKYIEQAFPNNADAQNAVLRHYLKSKDLKSVMASLRSLVLNKKFSAVDRVSLLTPFLENRNIDSSIKRQTTELVDEFAHQDPPQKEAIMLWADVLTADGHLDSALQAYKQVIEMDSNIFNPWQQVMYIYSLTSKPDSVIHYSRAAIQLFPKSYLPYYLGGMSWAQLKQNDSAIVYFKKAIQKSSGENYNALADVLASLGDVYNTMGSYKSSDSCYDAALELQPNNVNALNNFSYYLSLRGEKLDIAERMSAKSLRLRPDEGSFLDTYGWILYKQGKYQQAKEYIQKAIDRTKNNNDDGSLWNHLGDVEYKLGNKDKALEYWRKAVAKGSDTEEIQEKIKDQKLKD